MAPDILGSPREDVYVKEADFTSLQFTISFRGTDFVIRGGSDRVSIYRGSEDSPLGYIWHGSPRTGAIWTSDVCIADFKMNEDGRYTVTLIEELFRRPETTIEVDPIYFLLSTIDQPGSD